MEKVNTECAFIAEVHAYIRFKTQVNFSYDIEAILPCTELYLHPNFSNTPRRWRT